MKGKKREKIRRDTREKRLEEIKTRKYLKRNKREKI